MFSVLGDIFWTCDTWMWMFTFFKICRDFFRIFLAFYVAFCAYRPIPIRVAETDPSQCPPSRRPRPRLWTMVTTASPWSRKLYLDISLPRARPRHLFAFNHLPACILHSSACTNTIDLSKSDFLSDLGLHLSHLDYTTLVDHECLRSDLECLHSDLLCQQHCSNRSYRVCKTPMTLIGPKSKNRS